MTAADERAAFVARLRALVPDPSRPGSGDRAALAALRRGSGRGPGAVPQADRVFYSLGPPVGAANEVAAWLTATLMAQYVAGSDRPRGGASGGMGASLRTLVAKEKAGLPGVERRLQSALSASLEEIEPHLRGLVRLCSTNRVSVNWLHLMRDLAGWDSVERRPQRAWAREFWTLKNADATSGSPAPTDT
jgi:CRISPR type I-E-associated protein CasB/Cse2